MMDDILKGAIALAVLVVIAGIIGAAISDSDQAFSLAPFIDFFQGKKKEEILTVNSPQNPPSSGENLQLASPNNTDSRLSICPQGAIDSTASKVSVEKAQSLRQAILNGLEFKDLIEVQGTLGQPTCNFIQNETRQYRYLVNNDKTIDALQQGDKPDVLLIFTNF